MRLRHHDTARHAHWAFIASCCDARRSRPLTAFALRSGAQIPKDVPLRCWSFDHSAASSGKPRQRTSLTGGLSEM